MKKQKISIIIPVYNEEKTISSILDRVLRVNLGMRKEMVIVDDGSTDNSSKIIESYIRKHDQKKKNKVEFKFIKKDNGGKGSALRKGFEVATGSIITIQDADLEYDPEDYKNLIRPILAGKERVVYGSRFLKSHKPMYKIYFLGNKFLSAMIRFLYSKKITDMETCYKMFRSDVIKNIKLKANHFDIEPEITSKILKKGIRIKEVPISYHPRSIEEGKKINWRDGLQAIFTLLYLKFFN